MARTRTRRRTSLLAAALATSALVVAPLATADDSEAPLWETTTDSGALGSDVARFVATGAPSVNSPARVFVTGTRSKLEPLATSGLRGTLGVDDLDAFTAAYDAETGEEVWASAHAGGGSVVRPVDLQPHPLNGFLYVPMNAGSDIVTMSYSVRTGDEVSSSSYPNARANGSGLSYSGGYMGVAGTGGGDFLVLHYMTGAGFPLEWEDRPVRGEAFDADFPVTGAGIDEWRTLVVTGRSADGGGDLFTIAYSHRSGAELWRRSWGSDAGRRDEGLIVQADRVSDLGRSVAFVAGRTQTASGRFDLALTAYDALTGAPVWDGEVRTWSDPSGLDVEPVAAVYSDATSTLYVTATTKQGATGRDVVTLAFDALTGEQRAVTTATGHVANSTNQASGLAVSPDGERVFVSADIMHTSTTRRATLLAYDADLNPAGTRSWGQDDNTPARPSAGVALDSTGSFVYLAGSSNQGLLTGIDFHTAAFDARAFEVDEVETALAFTEASATEGSYLDDATLEVRLTDEDGTPLGDHEVTVALAGAEQTVTTDGTGLATAAFTLDTAPGTYTAAATFAGSGVHQPSSASMTFVVHRRAAGLTLHVEGAGNSRTLVARLHHADDAGAPIGERPVDVAIDGEPLATITTDEDTGEARLRLTGPHRAANRTFDADFAGDAYYLPASASTTS